ncbi:FtsH protease activity modulator HflK [bacterium]|nr:FtsH protease activity modulator HflK [bacterium]
MGGSGGGNNGGGGNGPKGPRGPLGGGGGPRRTPPNTPDLDEWLRRAQERIKTIFPGSGQTPIYIMLALVVLVLWLASGIYRVAPDENGVVLRFGQFHRVTGPGLRYHLPAPFETLYKPSVTRVQRQEIGFRSGGQGFMEGTVPGSIPEESLMLTGDENIVDINFEVQWRIRDPKAFLFNVRNPENTVKNAAESAVREVMGSTQIATALAEGRLDIEVKSKQLLQHVLDSYHSGVEVVRLQMLKVDPPHEVIDAFRDVQTARADMERLINQSETYRNDIIPKARGQAEKIVVDAEAYKSRVIAQSEGEAARFASVYKEYAMAKDVTRKRMYLETMEEIMRGMHKVVIDDKVQGAVPFLPLNELGRKPAETSSDAQ